MAEFWAALKGGLAILGAIPSILVAYKKLMEWLANAFGPDWPKRIEELKAAGEAWNAAQTTKEREDAAKALSAAFNSHK